MLKLRLYLQWYEDVFKWAEVKTQTAHFIGGGKTDRWTGGYWVVQLPSVGRGTHINSHSPVHAHEQGVKIEIVYWRLIYPFRLVTRDFESNPYPVHVFHAW